MLSIISVLLPLHQLLGLWSNQVLPACVAVTVENFVVVKAEEVLKLALMKALPRS